MIAGVASDNATLASRPPGAPGVNVTSTWHVAAAAMALPVQVSAVMSKSAASRPDRAIDCTVSAPAVMLRNEMERAVLVDPTVHPPKFVLVGLWRNGRAVSARPAGDGSAGGRPPAAAGRTDAGIISARASQMAAQRRGSRAGHGDLQSSGCLSGRLGSALAGGTRYRRPCRSSVTSRVRRTRLREPRATTTIGGMPSLRPHRPRPPRRPRRPGTGPRRADRLRVVVVGDLMLDVVLAPTRPLESGTDVPGRIALTQGGSAATTARWLARLGAR